MRKPEVVNDRGNSYKVEDGEKFVNTSRPTQDSRLGSTNQSSKSSPQPNNLKKDFVENKRLLIFNQVSILIYLYVYIYIYIYISAKSNITTIGPIRVYVFWLRKRRLPNLATEQLLSLEVGDHNAFTVIFHSLPRF